MSKKLAHWIIYGLFDPATEEIRYVGQTSYVLHHRLSRHLYEAKHLKVCDKKCEWINGLLASGTRPIIRELQKITDFELLASAETSLILHFRAIGAALFNETLGGPGSIGRVLRETTKRKIGDGNVGKGGTCRKGAQGKPHTAEARQKMSISRKGRTFSVETRARIGAAKKGIPSKLKGRARPIEVRQKISATKLGKGISSK